MNRKSKNWFYLLILVGLVFSLSTGCKEEDTNGRTEVGSVTDIDGNVYQTIKIGTQVWMKENLKVTKFNDGTSIPNVTDGTWSTLKTPAYCWYNNNLETIGNAYGALYNWYAVNTGKLCPVGWHVATEADWTTLANFLGGENVAGGKLQEEGTVHWRSTSANITNESGFTALPGGHRYNGGPFGHIEMYGLWWTSTETDTENAYYRCIGYVFNSVNSFSDNKAGGNSVRCVKD